MRVIALIHDPVEIWDGMVANWWSGADYGNLDSSLGSYRTGASFANGAYSFPEFDTRYAEYQAVTDPDAARRLAKELDMYVIEQHPYIWGVRVGSRSRGSSASTARCRLATAAGKGHCFVRGSIVN